MNGPRVFFIGTEDEVAAHAAPLRAGLPLEVLAPDEVEAVVRAGDLCIFYNEAMLRFRRAVRAARALRCATLFAVDGILEWRNSWEYPSPPGRAGEPSPDTMRPVLCHKIACLGRAQARILESWGNAGKCELVGVPRFDGLRPNVRQTPDGPRRVLIMTAKTPAFTPEQHATVVQCLSDVRDWFRAAERITEPVWRVTPELAQAIGVVNGVPGRGSLSVADTLQHTDAVLTTPSTAMLEGMLLGKPVALLDYHNRPHYVPAAWRVTCAAQLAQVVPQLLDPPAIYLQYQRFLLNDALEHQGSATARFIRLAEAMLIRARECVLNNCELTFPALLESQSEPPAANGTPAKDAERTNPDLERELTDLRCELTQLQDTVRRFETHPLLGPALKLRRALTRWLRR